MDLQPMPSLADQHRKIATPTLANRISELTSPNQQHNFIPTNGSGRRGSNSGRCYFSIESLFSLIKKNVWFATLLCPLFNFLSHFGFACIYLWTHYSLHPIVAALFLFI